ncbi:GDSL-type esterase/lipase family protein [Streptomyces sp. CB01881]|uniref:GDSL-type esterase/lipase family protein n=1 Tax=Streptomyces sp. CB01881 TaxID=2078691 RepID=UPI000CDC22E7|nr:GDSL-type esterase/lipase family protein [Streptomyces sp. CB01881]AUY54016.1 lipase [Streptomyces sp. CB01881]TYC77874.1 lipase [Streptomyces sp. CB01881]
MEFRGALHLERTAVGLRPWRLPAWTAAQAPGDALRRVAMMPSGVRLAFRTAATVLELALHAPPESPYPGAIELMLDGVRAGRAPLPAAGGPTVLRFDPGASDGGREVELWLPQWTSVELVALRADAPVHPPRPTGRLRWLHHGSSISQAPEADSAADVWPWIAAGRAGVDLLNLSLAGNAHLDPFTARTIRDQPADLISLKIGINVITAASFRLRTFVPAVHGFLDTVREGHPDTPLLVVSPLFCPPFERTPGPAGYEPTADGRRFTALGDPADTAAGALTLEVVRAELAAITAARAATDPHLHHLDGLALLGREDADGLGDLLHPNPAGHRRIGERFAALAFGPGGPFAATVATS